MTTQQGCISDQDSLRQKDPTSDTGTFVSEGSRSPDSSRRLWPRRREQPVSWIEAHAAVRTWVLKDECAIPATIRRVEYFAALACGGLVEVEEEFRVGVAPYLTAPS